MSHTQVELDNNSQEVVKYIQKYLEKYEKCYDRLLEVINHPKLENEFTDIQWGLIIEQAWRMAYRKALEDDFISLEERAELNNLYSLSMVYRNNPHTRIALNHHIRAKFKHMIEIDKKEDVYERKWEPPKPSPWDTNSPWRR